MIWKVFRLYFPLYLLPCIVLLIEQFSTPLGIDLSVVPVQYGYVVNTLFFIGCLNLFAIVMNEFFSRSDHVKYFGDKRKYSFVWTWIMLVPGLVAFHHASYGDALTQVAIFIILEVLRRRHNELWEQDEKNRIIQKAKDAKAERVEIDQ